METTFYLSQTAVIPMPLYRSMKGRYFVGCADGLGFGAGKSAWASLYNPPCSGVNLHLNIWTAISYCSAFCAQVWFNASMPVDLALSECMTAANLTLRPLPQPKVRLLHASDVQLEPQGGVKAFVRRGAADSTLAAEEGGKFIFAPGGSFSVLLLAPDALSEKTKGCISLSWWEEPLPKMSVYGSRSQRSLSHREEPSSRGKPAPGG